MGRNNGATSTCIQARNSSNTPGKANPVFLTGSPSSASRVLRTGSPIKALYTPPNARAGGLWMTTGEATAALKMARPYFVSLVKQLNLGSIVQAGTRGTGKSKQYSSGGVVDIKKFILLCKKHGGITVIKAVLGRMS